jgi:hypothetical protein
MIDPIVLDTIWIVIATNNFVTTKNHAFNIKFHVFAVTNSSTAIKNHNASAVI